MAYSTEKTYLMCLRSFHGFISGKNPDTPAVSDIQQFLSYLAVERKVPASAQCRNPYAPRSPFDEDYPRIRTAPDGFKFF
jgi:hypothetical protein